MGRGRGSCRVCCVGGGQGWACACCGGKGGPSTAGPALGETCRTRSLPAPGFTFSLFPSHEVPLEATATGKGVSIPHPHPAPRPPRRGRRPALGRAVRAWPPGRERDPGDARCAGRGREARESGPPPQGRAEEVRGRGGPAAGPAEPGAACPEEPVGPAPRERIPAAGAGGLEA